MNILFLQPVFLSIRLSANQGTIQCCSCSNPAAAHAYQPPSSALLLSSIPNQNPPLSTITTLPNNTRRANERCLYAIAPFCSILFECLKLNTKHLHDSATSGTPILLSTNTSHPTTPTHPNHPNNFTTPVDEMIDVVTPPPTPIRQTASGTEISATDGTFDKDQFHQQHPFNKHQYYPIINVIDAENEPVCLCSLYASTENELDRRPSDLTKTGTICRVCRNTIKLQPTEHRKTLISKRLTLANDIIVNRVDTHYLNLSAYPACIPDPYTPESVESHSPMPDDDKEENAPPNANVELSSDTVEGYDSKVASTGSIKSVSRAVSPGQLKSRLEFLQSNTLCKPLPSIVPIEPVAKKERKSRGCFERYCHII